MQSKGPQWTTHQTCQSGSVTVQNLDEAVSSGDLLPDVKVVVINFVVWASSRKHLDVVKLHLLICGENTVRHETRGDLQNKGTKRPTTGVNRRKSQRSDSFW